MSDNHFAKPCTPTPTPTPPVREQWLRKDAEGKNVLYAAENKLCPPHEPSLHCIIISCNYMAHILLIRLFCYLLLTYAMIMTMCEYGKSDVNNADYVF